MVPIQIIDKKKQKKLLVLIIECICLVYLYCLILVHELQFVSRRSSRRNKVSE